MNAQDLAFLNSIVAAPATSRGEGAAAGNQQGLFSVLASLLAQRGGSTAVASGGLDSQLQQQQQQQQFPAGFGTTGFLPQLQQQQANTFNTSSPPQQQSLGGLGNQQLVTLLLQQQQNKNNCFARTLGSLGEIKPALPATPGLELSSLLSLLGPNNVQNAAAPVPAPDTNATLISGDCAAESARDIALRKKIKLLPCRARGVYRRFQLESARRCRCRLLTAYDFFLNNNRNAHGSQHSCKCDIG
jgi:hypothetical protein